MLDFNLLWHLDVIIVISCGLQTTNSFLIAIFLNYRFCFSVNTHVYGTVLYYLKALFLSMRCYIITGLFCVPFRKDHFWVCCSNLRVIVYTLLVTIFWPSCPQVLLPFIVSQIRKLRYFEPASLSTRLVSVSSSIFRRPISLAACTSACYHSSVSSWTPSHLPTFVSTLLSLLPKSKLLVFKV